MACLDPASFPSPALSFMFNYAGVWHEIFITHRHTSARKHMSNGPMVFTSLVTTHSQEASASNTPIRATQASHPSHISTPRQNKTEQNKAATSACVCEAYRFLISLILFIVLPLALALSVSPSPRKTRRKALCVYQAGS